MSIAIALGNALSGLTAAQKGVEVVSNNVANAQTPGYARREVNLVSNSIGGSGRGVQVTGVERQVDMFVLGELRLSDAAYSGQEERLNFMSRIGGLIGTADDDTSLSGRIAHLEATLTEASNRPDSEGRLSAVAVAAGDIAKHLNQISDQIQQTRMETDDEIARVVDQLNRDLVSVRDLNVQIRTLETTKRDATGLMDARQNLIDRIAQVIPLRQVERDYGQLALISTGGAVLLDSSPVQFDFASVGVITADMTIQSGALSGLTMNGKPMEVGDDGRVGGGRLAALFDVRDGLATDAQARIDSVARDLYERFADPAVDPSIVAGDPGLFTDWGSAFDPLDEEGFAGRLTLNAAVDPAVGGSLWRLRSGIYAAAPTDPGDGTLLRAMGDALSVARAPASGPLTGITRSAGALTGELSAFWSSETSSLEARLSYAGSRADTLRALHLQDGVDTDQELQKLIVLEQAYGANAKVLSTIDDLMQTLIGL